MPGGSRGLEHPGTDICDGGPIDSNSVPHDDPGGPHTLQFVRPPHNNNDDNNNRESDERGESAATGAESEVDVDGVARNERADGKQREAAATSDPERVGGNVAQTGGRSHEVVEGQVAGHMHILLGGDQDHESSSPDLHLNSESSNLSVFEGDFAASKATSGATPGDEMASRQTALQARARTIFDVLGETKDHAKRGIGEESPMTTAAGRTRSGGSVPHPTTQRSKKSLITLAGQSSIFQESTTNGNNTGSAIAHLMENTDSGGFLSWAMEWMLAGRMTGDVADIDAQTHRGLSKTVNGLIFSGAMCTIALLALIPGIFDGLTKEEHPPEYIIMPLLTVGLIIGCIISVRIANMLRATTAQATVSAFNWVMVFLSLAWPLVHIVVAGPDQILRWSMLDVTALSPIAFVIILDSSDPSSFVLAIGYFMLRTLLALFLHIMLPEAEAGGTTFSNHVLAASGVISFVVFPVCTAFASRYVIKTHLDRHNRLRQTRNELFLSWVRSKNLIYSVVPKVRARITANVQPSKWCEFGVDDYGSCSIVQMDIGGFTSLSSQIDAAELVDIVNAVFTSIDNCADFIGSVWKAETIGDCYIALIGGPLPSRNHSYRAVVFAISILQTMKRISKRLKIQLDVRVGVHSGQVTSGVIGSLMPKYLMFGRDCSITAELEKQAPPNTVLVSETTMKQIGSGWEDHGVLTVPVPGLSIVKASILMPSRTNHDMMMKLKQYQQLHIFQRMVDQRILHQDDEVDAGASVNTFERSGKSIRSLEEYSEDGSNFDASAKNLTLHPIEQGGGQEMCRLSVPGKIDSVDDKVEGAKSENDGILTSNKAGERGRARGSISSMVRLLPELAPATLEVRSNVRSDESSSAKTSKSLISQSHVEATFETYEERMSRGASSSEVGTNRVSNISNDNLRPSAESHTDSSNRSLNRSNVVSMGIADPAVLRRELDNIKMELGAARPMRKNKSMARIQKVKSVLSTDGFMEGKVGKGIGLTRNMLRDDVNWLGPKPKRDHRRGSIPLKPNMSDGMWLQHDTQKITAQSKSSKSVSNLREQSKLPRDQNAEEGDREGLEKSERHSTDGVARVKAGAMVGGKDVRRRASLPASHSPSTPVMSDPQKLRDAPPLMMEGRSASATEGLSEIDKDIEVQSWLHVFDGFSSSSDGESSEDSEIEELWTEADADAARAFEMDNTPRSFTTSNGGTYTHSIGGVGVGTHDRFSMASRGSFETGKSWGRPEKLCPSERESKASMYHGSYISMSRNRSTIRSSELRGVESPGMNPDTANQRLSRSILFGPFSLFAGIERLHLTMCALDSWVRIFCLLALGVASVAHAVLMLSNGNSDNRATRTAMPLSLACCAFMTALVLKRADMIHLKSLFAIFTKAIFFVSPIFLWHMPLQPGSLYSSMLWPFVAVVVNIIELVSSELARKDDDDLSSERFMSPWMILHLLFVTASLILLGVFGTPDHQHESDPRWSIVVYILHHMIPTALFIVPLLVIVRKYQMDEKEKQVLIERSKKQIKVENDLLSSLVPPSISQRLRSGEERIADFYPSTTVMFIYFDDFNSILIEHGSVRTISWVNRVQLALDKTVHSCKGSVLKVQTFSNFYLVVAGCSQKGSASHAEDCVRAAVMMMMQARTLMDPNDQPTALKFGINSGSLCAGCVGRETPRFSIFGDTVNTASRMATTGVRSVGDKMACQISEMTYSTLSGSFIATLKKTGFTIDSRDDVFVKGKGLMHTFNIASIPIGGSPISRSNGRNGRTSTSIGIGTAHQRSPMSRGAAASRSRWGPSTRLERIQSGETQRYSDSLAGVTIGDDDSSGGVDTSTRRRSSLQDLDEQKVGGVEGGEEEGEEEEEDQ